MTKKKTGDRMTPKFWTRSFCAFSSLSPTVGQGAMV
jgi:hypothetical protein